MSAWQLQTPVAFLIFNRPESTARVFAEIAKARPPKLLVIADGPRSERAGEAERCRLARAVIDQVDWPCDVLTCYAENNLGCRRRVSSGLTWAFETVEEAIVLEDDCLPHPSFFRFSEELLEKYRDDERISQISGDDFQLGRTRFSNSYYFSRYAHVWGWASWRRAWKNYDVKIQRWPELRDSGFLSRVFVGDRQAANYWINIFDRVYQGEIDTWDYQWLLTCWINEALVILPSVNLVSNIGFDLDATHTKVETRFANLRAYEMHYPLCHPAAIARDIQADQFTEQEHLLIHNAPNRLVALRRVLADLVRVRLSGGECA